MPLSGDPSDDSSFQKIYQDPIGRVWFIPFSNGKLSYYYRGKMNYRDIKTLIEDNSQITTGHLPVKDNVEPLYTTVWFLIAVILLVAAGLFAGMRLVLHRKFRNRQNALQQKKAIEQERSRIAADIHDDLGAELTNIVILSQILKYTPPEDRDESLKVICKIEASSSQIVSKMNEVIWTLDTKNHTLKSLVSRIRNYTVTLCETTQTTLRITVTDVIPVNYPLPVEYTRNIFLIAKELLSNALKHSGAQSVTIAVSLTDLYRLCFDYFDDGIGFDPGKSRQGNGLKNIRRRVSECRGDVSIQSAYNKGCRMAISFPLTVLKQ